MPENLFYYCSSATFFSLIGKRKLWLTSLNHSNDGLEGLWALQQYKALAKRSNPGGTRKVDAALSPFFYERYAFGMCFSEKDDLLSQWRGYAEDGTGFSIAFKPEAIERLARSYEQPPHKLRYAQVKYGRLENHGFVQKIYDVFGQDIESVRIEENFTTARTDLSPEKWETAGQFYEYKNDAFEEELEWRLYCIQSLPENDIFEFTPRAGAIRPHIELTLDPELVDYVRLGPKNQTPESVVKAFMRKNAFEPNVVTSAASYQ